MQKIKDNISKYQFRKKKKKSKRYSKKYQIRYLILREIMIYDRPEINNFESAKNYENFCSS